MTENFFLLDVMGTDNSHLTSEYLKMSEYSIDLTPSYYKLHNFSLQNYKRRFAIIDHRILNMDLWNNEEYWRELELRIIFLSNKNFVFLLGQPWEFVENMTGFKAHNRYLKLLEKVPHMIWDGYNDWFWFYLQHSHKNKDYNFNHTNKTKDFLYLNKRARPHRIKLYDKLTAVDALKNSIVSFVDNPYKKYLDKKYELYNLSDVKVDIPEYIGIKSKLNYGLDHNLNKMCYDDSAVSIVSESTVSKQQIFLSEKVWKPIVAQHIFVIHGQPNTLKTLKELGFKTFDTFFDESYDVEQDEDIKINKIVKSCQQILSLNFEELYKKTEEIRLHNYKLFFNENALSNLIKKRLDLFFKLFDSGKISS